MRINENCEPSLAGIYEYVAFTWETGRSTDAQDP